MPRFYCPVPLASGAVLALPADAARHVQVLRLQPSHAITLFDGTGGEWDAQVTRMGRNEVLVAMIVRPVLSEDIQLIVEDGVRKDLANLSARGAYVLAEAEGKRQVTLLATGSEVHLALAARDLLKARGIAAAVVSMPCWALFDGQERDYRAAVLGTAPRIAVEAASTFGWERYVGEDGTVIGMTGFGASAPAEDLYRFFGITAEKVAEAAAKRL